MQVYNNVQLLDQNTFGLRAIAKLYARFTSVQELEELLSDLSKNVHGCHPMILGGGSNILLTKDQDLVLKNEISGINIVHKDQEYVYVNAGAGVNWHQLVLYCVSRNLGGIENLSLIPGNAGAAPMQNIGAYGVELKDIFFELRAFHLFEKVEVKFNASDCAFGYRESVFKKKYKGQFSIIDITLKLKKHPVFNISYSALLKELENNKVEALTVEVISNAVVRIRNSKLPDPKIIGNAGSFFKNPEITPAKHDNLLSEFPLFPMHTLENGNWKLPAGWMIEQCGYKGLRRGDTGCYEKQALVLVNFGNATGEEIYAFSEEIALAVYTKFGIALEREVNIW